MLVNKRFNLAGQIVGFPCMYLYSLSFIYYLILNERERDREREQKEYNKGNYILLLGMPSFILKRELGAHIKDSKVRN